MTFIRKKEEEEEKEDKMTYIIAAKMFSVFVIHTQVIHIQKA